MRELIRLWHENATLSITPRGGSADRRRVHHPHLRPRAQGSPPKPEAHPPRQPALPAAVPPTADGTRCRVGRSGWGAGLIAARSSACLGERGYGTGKANLCRVSLGQQSAPDCTHRDQIKVWGRYAAAGQPMGIEQAFKVAGHARQCARLGPCHDAAPPVQAATAGAGRSRGIAARPGSRVSGCGQRCARLGLGGNGRLVRWRHMGASRCWRQEPERVDRGVLLRVCRVHDGVPGLLAEPWRGRLGQQEVSSA
jgi:hypothetical protein